jgi:UDP-N-acetylglucosamine--N-acetylmuramyl-(pentapeptide) pyrophosphoryl-undecaprenol N-acetylglucosamine transferase
MEKLSATQLRLMLAGGGTAGHVNPLLAVAEAVRAAAPGTQLQWTGSERIESRLVPQAGVEFRQLDIRFSWRRPTPGNWGYYRRHILPLLAGRPFRQALAVLQAFRPQLLLASGGYVSAPAVWAAQRLGIPFALLQLDDPPGLVNWWFAPGAVRIYCATDSVVQRFSGRCAVSRLQVAGYPAMKSRLSRSEFYAAQGVDPARKLLLVMGGSLGAGAVHRLARQLLEAAAEQGDPRWKQLALLNVGGEREALAQQALGAGPDGPVTLHQTGYLDHAVDAFAAADFYLGRCGAATAGELVACGIPALLIPDPQHPDRQQYRNADWLGQRGQAQVYEQGQVDGATVLRWLRQVWDTPRLPVPDPPAAQLVAADLLRLGAGL